jgi:hypothetical protein
MREIRKKKVSRHLGKNQQKILLLLLGGVALGLTRSPKHYYRIVRGMVRSWKEINRGGGSWEENWEQCDWKYSDAKQFKKTVDSLYASKLVKRTEHKDGSVTLVLSEEGRRRALRYHLETLTIQPQEKWDGKWRVVMYDIPERIRGLRQKMYRTLRTLGFVELQHSIFVHPFECVNEIEFLIEAYNARPYVRRMLVEEIDISKPLRKAFAHVLENGVSYV